MLIDSRTIYAAKLNLRVPVRLQAKKCPLLANTYCTDIIGLIIERGTPVNYFFYFSAQLVRSSSCAEFQWVPRTESLKSKIL